MPDRSAVRICRPSWRFRSEIFCKLIKSGDQCKQLQAANKCKQCGCITSGGNNGLACTYNLESDQCFHEPEVNLNQAYDKVCDGSNLEFCFTKKNQKALCPLRAKFPLNLDSSRYSETIFDQQGYLGKWKIIPNSTIGNEIELESEYKAAKSCEINKPIEIIRELKNKSIKKEPLKPSGKAIDCSIVD